MWRFSGGDVVVTVDAETGLLNAVDWAKSAGSEDRSVPPTRLPGPDEAETVAAESIGLYTPSPWLWGLLALPAAALAWAIVKTKGAKR